MTRAALAAALLAVLVHLNAVGNGFAYDDEAVIVGNPAIHDVSRLGETLVRPYWPGTYAEAVGMWRPVVTGMFTLEWAVADGDPRLFHAVGVVLHGAAAAVVVLVLAHLLPPAGALAGGLAFAVHPVHVEAVANVVGHAEVIAGLFALLALLVHLGGGERYGAARAAGVGLLFAVALLAKEGAAVVPGLVFLVDAARRDLRIADAGAYLRRRWPTWAALAAVLAGVLLARGSVLGSMSGEQGVPGASLLDSVPRIYTLAGVWPHYVRLLLFPADLAAEYGGIVTVALGWEPWNVAGALLVLLLLGAAWWSCRTGPPMSPTRSTVRSFGVAVVWFGLAILPVSNLLFLSPVFLAERNLYLPSVAAALGVGWLAGLLHRHRPRVAMVAVGLVVVAGGLRTWQRNPVWRDTTTVFASLLEDHPEAGRAWLHRGETLFAEGRHAEARRAFAVALGRLDSEYSPSVHVASRLMAMDPGSRRAAEFLLRRAWRERPDYYTAPGWLAAMYLNEGRHREGVEAALAAVAVAPDNAEMHRILAAHLSGLGSVAEAVVERRRALALHADPPWSWWVWLARDEARLGARDRALAALDSARRGAPAAATADLDSLEAELVGAPARGESPAHDRSTGSDDGA